MNTRRFALRNCENIKVDQTDKNVMSGVTTRKRAALQALENTKVTKTVEHISNIKKRNKVVQPVIENAEPMNDNKENNFNFEYFQKNPLTWPKAEDFTCEETKFRVLENVIARRKAIRTHYHNLTVDGKPIWFLTKQNYQDEYMHWEYLANINDYLIEAELLSEPLGRNFLENSAKIGYRQRYMFVNWMVTMHIHFRLSAETLHLSIAICDRFIKANKATVKFEDLVVIGMIGFFIAAKCEEVNPPPLNQMRKLFKVEYTLQFCKDLESEMLETLKFKLTFPLPICFVRHYNVVIEADSYSHYLSRYFCELSLQDYEASGYSVNLMGASCVFLAQVVALDVESNFEQVWTEKLQTASGLLYLDLRPLIRNLCLIVGKQPTKSNYRAISTKYSDEKLMNVRLKSLTSIGFKSIVNYFKNSPE